MLNRAGAQNSYSHNVRIGNWNEDKELDELRMKEYLHRKANGDLLVHKIQAHLNQSLTEVGLTFSRDETLHFGDAIMLYSVQTEGVLSVDMSANIGGYDTAYTVTSSTLTQAPVARNVFIVEGVGNVRPGDQVRLGQPFRLRAHDQLAPGQTMFLNTQPVSTTSFSKMTRNQEVVCAPTPPTHDTVWTVQYKDISKRFEMEGQPVPTNAEVVIQHAATRAALSSDKKEMFNDFGKEFEVCGKSNVSVNKKQGLYQEKQGFTTTDIPVRAEDSRNHWAFLSASVDPNATQPAS